MARWMVSGGAVSGGTRRSSSASTSCCCCGEVFAQVHALFGAERLGLELAFSADQHFDAGFGFLELLAAGLAERDALLEEFERALERQVAALQFLDDALPVPSGPARNSATVAPSQASPYSTPGREYANSSGTHDWRSPRRRRIPGPVPGASIHPPRRVAAGEGRRLRGLPAAGRVTAGGLGPPYRPPPATTTSRKLVAEPAAEM